MSPKLFTLFINLGPLVFKLHTLNLRGIVLFTMALCGSFEKKVYPLFVVLHLPLHVFYMKPSIMHTFKVGFSWVISISWEKGTHPSELGLLFYVTLDFYHSSPCIKVCNTYANFSFLHAQKFRAVRQRQFGMIK